MRILKLQFLIFVLISGSSYAQNARFSQLGTSTQMLNPALTGRFDGQARLGALFSYQDSRLATTLHQNVFLEYKFGKYRSSGDEDYNYVTKDNAGANISAEARDKIAAGNKPAGYWAAGLNYYHYGYKENPLAGSFYSVSLARHFYPKRNKYWGVGVQGTYAMGKLDEKRGIIHDREISGDGFVYPQGTPTGTRTGEKNYVDFNVGGYYGMVTEPVAFEIGGSMGHLFYPKSDIFDKDNEKKQRHRVTAHSMLRLKFNDKWGIVQKNYYWQEGLYLRSRAFNKDSVHITDFWAGVEFYKTDPTKKVNFSFGLYTRSFRTVMPYANLYLGKVVNLRASYEAPLNVNKFTAYTAKRAELAMILTYKKNTNPGTELYKKVNFW